MSKKGKLLESYVQTIPYGKPLHSSNIKVNDRGEIVIIGNKKTWYVKDIDAAIRQQLFHVAAQYEDMIVNWKKQIIHKGSISELEEAVIKINQLLNNLEKMHGLNTTQLNEEIISPLKKLKTILENKEVNNLEILEKIINRGFLLLEEKMRCENIIRNALSEIVNIIYYIDFEPDKLQLIKWGNFFETIKKVLTIHVNPYRNRIQISLFRKKIKYEVFKNIKSGNLEKAKNILWQGIYKLIPIYPKELTFSVGKKKIKIINGIISFIE